MPKRLTTEKFIAKAREKHGDTYDYSKVDYKNTHKNVTITCKIHGDFPQTPANHTHKMRPQGCSKCGVKRSAILQRSNAEEFIAKAREKHGDTHDYSKVDYKNNGTCVTITCKIHGDFPQTPNNHLSGHGCSKCAKNQQKSTEQFIMDAQKIHGDKYDYTEVEYKNTHNIVIITCKIHGDFPQTPNNHLRGQGCPKCAKAAYSKMAIDYLNTISIKNNVTIQHAENGGEHRIKGSRFKADGYCDETNTIYEFHGDVWHGNPKTQDPDYTIHNKSMEQRYKETKEREEFIKEQGYDLVVMWENEWVNRLDVMKCIRSIIHA